MTHTGNNDVLPKRQPLTQEWLEDFGAHLLKEAWLTREEYEGTWKAGGFYKRDLGAGLCAIILNSNSWTANQINEDHHAAQLKWLGEEAFADEKCTEYLLNAHVPLGWLENSQGHHEWTNLAWQRGQRGALARQRAAPQLLRLRTCSGLLARLAARSAR